MRQRDAAYVGAGILHADLGELELLPLDFAKIIEKAPAPLFQPGCVCGNYQVVGAVNRDCGGSAFVAAGGVPVEEAIFVLPDLFGSRAVACVMKYIVCGAHHNMHIKLLN